MLSARRFALVTASLGLALLTFAADKSAPRFQAGPAYSAKARVAIDKPTHAISDGIYGVCGWPKEKLIEYRIAITRWGGNPSTRYNWKLNVDNGASDWYFKNRGKLIKDLADSGYLKHITGNQAFAATTYQTVPTIGWVAKDDRSYGFSVAKYGAQKASEPGHADIGNGVKKDGGNVAKNDPRDSSVPAPPEFIAEAVAFVAKQAGKADAGGVKYWVLDNEPMLWHETHRDVHPDPLGYDELWDRTVRYAEAIKKADPSAKVAGFCSWGFMDLFWSAKDKGTDNFRTKADHQAHGKVGLAEWFIQKCGDARKASSKPLVDVMDVHWYPQGNIKGQGGPYQGKGMGAELNEYRLRSTRDLWDKTYEQEKGISWIRNTDPKPVALIPRVREWIDQHNPGMEICVGEYNFGGGDNVTGGLAQADVFGILARARVDLAFIWHTPAGTQELAWKLFRSYDGQKSGFGEEFLETESDSPDLAVYAARRKADAAVTIAAINKNLHGDCKLSLNLSGLKGDLRVWRFDQETGDKVVEVKEQARTVDGKVELTLPPASASMIVIVPKKAG